MRYLILSFLFGILFCTGCVKENLDDCPDDQYLLIQFEYTDLKGNDVYQERLVTIDLAIFDSERSLIILDTYQTADLSYQSVRYNLTPGTYYIACWANNRSIPDNSPGLHSNMGAKLEELILSHYDSEGIDPLHYSPDYREISSQTPNNGNGIPGNYDLYKVEVLPQQITYRTQSFMCAYRTIYIYMSGIENELPSYRSEEYPMAAVSNSPGHYSYFLESVTSSTIHFGKRTTYYEEADPIYVDAGMYARAGIRVPHFQSLNEMVISITPQLPYQPQSVRLEEFLRNYSIDIFDGDELELHICFHYLNDVYAEVKMLDWENMQVDPEF